MERTGRPTCVDRLSVSLRGDRSTGPRRLPVYLVSLRPPCPPHSGERKGGVDAASRSPGGRSTSPPSFEARRCLLNRRRYPRRFAGTGIARRRGPGPFPPALPTLGALQGLKGRLPPLRCGGRAAQTERARAYAPCLRAVFCSGVCPQTQHHRGGGLRGRPRSPCPPCVPCRAR